MGIGLGKRLLTAAVLAVAVAGAALAQQKSFQSPGDCVSFAASSYADTELSVEGRKEAAERMRQAADTWKDDYAVQWRTAQALFAYGDTLYHKYQVENLEAAKGKIKNAGDVIARSQALSKEQSATLLSVGEEARVCADRAVKINPDGVEGRYYAALSIALYSFGKSIVSALVEGLGPKYESNLDRAKAIDPGFMDGAPLAAYGRYWNQLPWPKRDNKKSLELLKAAERISPDHIVIENYLGDTYYALGKKEDALRSWGKSRDSHTSIYNSGYIKKLVEAKLGAEAGK